MCNRNITLERRAKIAATVDIILAALNLIFGSIDLRKAISIEDDAESTPDEREEAKTSRYLILVLLVIASTKFIMGFVLWVGADKKLSTYVRAWLIISVILWIVLVSDFIAKLAAGAFLIYTTVTTSLTILVRLFVFYVIVLFIRQIESENPIDDGETGGGGAERQDDSDNEL